VSTVALPPAAPALRVEAGGAVAARDSEGYRWVVHRDGRSPVAWLTTPLAGLGAGERLDARVAVAPGAAAVVTAPGPTVWLETATEAVQRWALEVGEGGHLTFLPWVAIPFPGSRSRSEVDVVLAPGAGLVAWETFAAGRVGRGERFRFAELRSAWRVTGPDGVLLDDRLAVTRADAEHAEALLAGRTHVGTLLVGGPAESRLPEEELHELLARSGELGGISRPAPGLLVARLLAGSADRVERALWPLVAAAREAAGQEPLRPERVARRFCASLAGVERSSS
jgi:urease accessory protein